jgi:23S rRNA pseudouridine1911/1915/1917 synthase
MDDQTFTVSEAQEGITLAAFLRACLPGQSWSQVRALVRQRRVRLNGELWLDDARRVHTSETVDLLKRPQPKPHEGADIVLRHLDEHVVVVEKPAGINTVRHPAEREWGEQRKALTPTLEDLVPRRISLTEKRPSSGRLRIVQRLDKETSGLVVFARSVLAERILGQQFHDHTVLRRYIAIAHGKVRTGTIHTWLIRDRGDGRRGSAGNALRGVPAEPREIGKEAITHVELLEELPGGYSRIACKLETGRTHQIRIHLAEQGHPICGDKVYIHRPDGTLFPDRSGAPRLCLHAAELGFVHPASGENLHWEMPLPDDLETFLACLRAGAERP